MPLQTTAGAVLLLLGGIATLPTGQQAPPKAAAAGPVPTAPNHGLEDAVRASSRGRFTHQRRNAVRDEWKRVDGGDLVANTYMPILPRTERVPLRKR